MNKVADTLLEIKAIKIEPVNKFRWTSGALSPVYIDNRIIGSFPKARSVIYKSLSQLVKEHYPDVEIILGAATGGIIPAAFVAAELDLPVGYIRSRAKEHGTRKAVEGSFQKNQKAVVIEDLISTGGSALQAAQAASNDGLDVLGIAAIFSYQLDRAIQSFTDHNIVCVTLTNLDELLTMAENRGVVTKAEAIQVKLDLSHLFS